MGRSDDYIDFNAYVGYLRKVTGHPGNPQDIRRIVLEKADERTEMQTAYMLLKKLAAAMALLIVVLGLIILLYMISGDLFTK